MDCEQVVKNNVNLHSIHKKWFKDAQSINLQVWAAALMRLRLGPRRPHGLKCHHRYPNYSHSTNM
jgi:hypothetical protein